MAVCGGLWRDGAADQTISTINLGERPDLAGIGLLLSWSNFPAERALTAPLQNKQDGPVAAPGATSSKKDHSPAGIGGDTGAASFLQARRNAAAPGLRRCLARSGSEKSVSGPHGAGRGVWQQGRPRASGVEPGGSRAAGVGWRRSGRRLFAPPHPGHLGRPGRRARRRGRTTALRAALSLLCAAAWLLVSLGHAAAALPLNSLEKFHFKSWMVQHQKEYSAKEYHYRQQIFNSNWRKIKAHNKGNHTFKMGLNQFSDMSFAEIKRKYLWSEPQNCSATKSNYFRGTGPYPTSVDWRKKGNFVSPVKNQGACGSCWTFSTTGALESAVAIASGKMLSLSEQQLVDCAQNFNNHGCQGGLPSQAFEYILYNKGIMGENSYPYKGKDGHCSYQPQKAIAFVKDVVNITLNDEEAMVEAVALYNPVSFAFEVTEDFMSYRSGIYSSTSCHKTPDKVNHAVLAVGYGVNRGVPYWIVKNSWGTAWGKDGYFLIERGKNMCGLAACASYPIPQV